MARDTAEVGLKRLAAAIAVIAPGLALVQTLANAHEYRYPVVAIMVWPGVLAAAAWLVPRLRAGRLTAGETAAAIVIAVVAVIVADLARKPHGNPASVGLAILGTAWLLVFVLLSSPARVWVPAALLVYAAHGALLIRAIGLNGVSGSLLSAAAYILAAILIAFAALRPTMAMHATIAARRASLATRSVAERAAAAAIGAERRDRLAVLESEALPLLRLIAGGTLDPAGDGVREECARHATVLRDSLTHSATARTAGAGDLAATLEPALGAARDRGLPVTVQVIGDPGATPPPVARAARAAVDAVISRLPPPHQVVLTVLAPGDDVELYLTFGALPGATPDLTQYGQDLPAAVRWHAALVATEAGGGCLEVSWRKDSTP